MKKISLITSLIFILSLNFTAQGQIGEWIADQIKSKIEEEILGRVNSVVNYNSERLGAYGNYIWDAVVNSKCESDLKNKALEFKNFQINKSYLDKVPKKYPDKDKYWTKYDQLTPVLNKHTNTYFHTKYDIKFNQVADAKIDKYAILYIDSLSSSSKIDSLESLLNPSVLDSLKLFSYDNEISGKLLEDIKDEGRLPIFLNNYPAAVRVYYNSILIPSLRKNISHLYYWTVKADSHRSILKKKKCLINPRNVKFSPVGDKIELYDGVNKIGYIQSDNLYVQDVNLLNLSGRPNTIYIFENNKWETDDCGRVINATQITGKNIKRNARKKF